MTSEPAPLDRADVQRFCENLDRTIDELSGVLEEETALVREARLEEAFAIADRKSALADAYLRAHETMRAASREISRLAPVELARLRRRHEVLQEKLTANMAVVGMARTVAESLIRGAADAVHGPGHRTGAYSADARQAGEAPARPLSLNVAL